MEVDALLAEKHLQRIAPDLGFIFRQKVDVARIRMEHALAQWGETKAKIRDLKHAAWTDSEPTRQQWKLKLQDYETRLEAAREEWRAVLQGLPNNPRLNK